MLFLTHFERILYHVETSLSIYTKSVDGNSSNNNKNYSNYNKNNNEMLFSKNISA